MSNRTNFAKNTLFQYALQIARYIFPFLLIPFLTRALGPEIYAIRAYVLAAMTLLQVFLDFGLNPYGIRAIAKSSSLHEQQIETSSITYLRLILCAIGAVALIPLTLFIPIMSQYPAYVAIAYMGVCCKTLLPDFVFAGQQDMGIITYRYIVTQLISLIPIIAFVKGPGDLIWVAIWESLAAAIALVWSWENVLRIRRISFTATSLAKMKTVLQESGLFFLSTASTTLLTSLTTLFIGILVSNQAEISYWALAMSAISAVQALYTPITNSLFPHMTKDKDYVLAKRLLISGNIVNIVGTIAFWLLAKHIVLVLGGNEFLPAARLLQIVTPLLLFSFPAMMLGYPILAAAGQTKQLTKTSLASAGFHIIGLCVLALLGAFTVEAVGILRVGSEIVLCAMRIIYARSSLAIK